MRATRVRAPVAELPLVLNVAFVVVVFWLAATPQCFRFIRRVHGVVVPHPLCMRKAFGSITNVSIVLHVAVFAA